MARHSAQIDAPTSQIDTLLPGLLAHIVGSEPYRRCMAAPTTSEPKCHHYLPQTYVAAWRGAADAVTVRRRDSSRTFDTGTAVVGVERHLYGKGAAAVWREKNFGLLESQWPALRTELVTTGHAHGQNKTKIATFMALQVARTREHLLRTTVSAELAAFTDERPISQAKVKDFFRVHLRQEAGDAEVEAAWSLVNYELSLGIPSIDEAFSISMDVAIRHMAPLFENLHWRVEQTRDPVLWTSDRPVMPWRPPSERDAFEGVGYQDADEIRMPLSPTAVLIAQRRYATGLRQVTSSRFHDYNGDIARQCYEFVVCTPGRKSRLEKLELADRRPAVRFHVGPGFEVGPDGTETRTNDVLHSWVPLRDDGVPRT